MNAIYSIPTCPAHRSRGRRGGITLLEVLVACGILVVGLASIASVLPAAGSRLSQAALEDRTGAAAANAYAEMVNRGLIAVDLFGSGTTKACVLGQTLPAACALAPASTFLVSATAVAPSVMQARIDPVRGFQLEDELVYKMPTTADTPNNSFVSGTSGAREYREGVCWGAMLAPRSGTAEAGGVATLSIAVFKKPGDAQVLGLTGGGPMFQYTTGSANGVIDEAIRKQLLAGCSYVLALPTTAATPPRWIKINSSWTNPGPGIPEDSTQRKSYVVLELAPLGSGTATLISSGSMTVIGFRNLIRVDQYPVTLE